MKKPLLVLFIISALLGYSATNMLADSDYTSSPISAQATPTPYRIYLPIVER